ncbi:E3 ubiquitin-protein ligase XB3-like [Dioscorea cayenensis subsp. rotundata]|uniref:RING-type E3 ubiquitin transferase n=1 Tax=Dioscorea cayennensis subsp. rotundata TaxID=55577 RepID=A0AB40CA21_DIOCR|nr:E3 ubiquitin-protein ligase XB3-like [Dioscorea cayenensis subsp. rotundata]
MGQGVSCSRSSYEHEFFTAVQSGDLELVELALRRDPEMVFQTTIYDRLSALHIAAANGRVEVICMILDQSGNPDLLNRHKQTPLMLAAMHGKVACVHKLLQAGANILMFDSLHGRTCLHYAAYYGHSDCLQVILDAARSSPVTDSWGFTRFVNVRDDTGATPLHLAARHRRPNCVHILLENGALSCASTGGYGFPGSTPLHFAARGGCLDCVRELLVWGADRLQRDSSGRIPFMIALKKKHGRCATLLNPSSPGPLVWPSPLKFISELDQEAKLLLEAALMEANREREKSILKGAAYSVQSPIHSDDGTDDNVSETSESELCCICFDQVCTIEVQACGHQMCAHCILSLCCHNKPDPTTLCVPAPLCPFCRSDIARLVVVKTKTLDDGGADTPSRSRRSRRSRNLSEGSNSFKGLSTLGSFTKMTGRGSGLKADSSDTTDKP